ncbi:hypothetical protein PINS_up002457 [Pythium insidiosum]|nr:hypothetical protein PINS_up002457 [Pythium insidiosum]
MRQPVGLFVTTFNMGEGSITHDELAKWIPRGYDIYVIGVQECLQLQELRQMLRRHIEGDEQRSGARASSTRSRLVRYKMFCREIGSATTTLGYHVSSFHAESLLLLLLLLWVALYADTPLLSGIHRSHSVLCVSATSRPARSSWRQRRSKEVNCGMALPFGQRASNKGAVGLGFPLL